MKTIHELRELTSAELQTELLSLRKEQFVLRMKKSNDTLDKTHLVRVARRAIAKVKTVMTEKAGTSHV